MKKLGIGIWGALASLAVGTLYFAYSFKYHYSSPIGPGPGFFARWLSALLVILAAIYLIEAVRGRDSAGKADRKSMTQVLRILMVMVLYVLLLPVVGFNVASVAFLFVLLLKAYKWQVNLAISVASALAIYFLFGALGVQLPLNALGF